MESSKEIQRIKEELEEALGQELEQDSNNTKKVKYIWVSDGGSCEECSSLDGRIFDSLNEAPSLPLHPNCKCTIETIEVEENTGLDEGEERSFLDKMKEVLELSSAGKDAGKYVPLIFLEEYVTMMSTNAKGNDKHQHAMANARATSEYGKYGEEVAIDISDRRDNPEKFGTMGKEQREDSEADQAANKAGRDLGLKYPNASREFLSDKLKEEYGIDNQHYREGVWDAINQSGGLSAVVNQIYNRFNDR